MAGENVERLQLAFEAFARGDIDAVAENIDPDFQIEDSILIDAWPSVRGVEALKVNADKFREAFGDVSWEPQEIVELGDQILFRVRLEGEGRTTSLAMEQLNPDQDIGHPWTLRDGRALSLRIYRTWGEARAAAGMQG
jgi:ketosteroid isomerase-like protein